MRSNGDKIVVQQFPIEKRQVGGKESSLEQFGDYTYQNHIQGSLNNQEGTGTIDVVCPGTVNLDLNAKNLIRRTGYSANQETTDTKANRNTYHPAANHEENR